MDDGSRKYASWWKAAVVALPALLAAVVGAWAITTPSLWRDESVTVYFARVPIHTAWREWGRYDAVHATYDLLVRLTIWIDPIELGVRLPSLMAFVAATIGIVLIGKRLDGWLLGVCAATVYVLIPATSRYAQEGRSYALISAVAIFATLALLRLVERPSWRRTMVYAVVVALVGYLHLYALLLLIPHGVFVLIAARAALRRLVFAWVVAGLAVMPLVLVAAGQRERQLFWLTSPGWSDLVDFGTFFGATTGLGIVLGLLGLLGAWTLRRAPLPLLWATLPVVASFAISQFYPVYNARYLLFVAPALALLVGAGVCAVAQFVGRGSRGVTGSVVLLALALVAVLGLPVQRENREPAGRSEDLRSLTREFAAEVQPGDVLLDVADRLPFANVYGGPFDRLPVIAGDAVPATVDRVWIVTLGQPQVTPGGNLYQFSKTFELAELRPFGATALSLWTRRER